MRWENTSPCPMIIFFNLFLSSRHAVNNIFSFSGSSPSPRGLWSQDQRKAKKLWRFFSPSHNRVKSVVNRNLKFWSSLISLCVLSSRAQWALEKSYFIFWKGKELKAAWTISLYVDENFSHSFQIKVLRFIDKRNAHYRRHFLIAEQNSNRSYVIRSLQLTNQVPFLK